jgi:multidrug efflux pump subunit AcrA (membrane-fusion protein)
MKLRRISSMAFACVLLLAACQPGEDAAGKTEAQEDEETALVPVETTKPIRGDVYAVYSGTAPIEAFADADVIAKVEGEVREILFEEGNEVKEGDGRRPPAPRTQRIPSASRADEERLRAQQRPS